MPLPRLLELALHIVSQEEAQANQLTKTVTTITKKLKQQIHIRKNLDTPTTIFSDKGEGKIDEITIISTTPDITIKIVVDNYIVINNSWNELNEISKYITWASTIEDDNNYIISLTNINYTNTIEITAYGNTKIKTAIIKITKSS